MQGPGETTIPGTAGRACTAGAIDGFQGQRFSLGQEESHRSRVQSSDSKIMGLS